IGRRRPDLGQRALRHQALGAQRSPERTTDCASIGPAVEDRADDFGLARASITMLAEVAVEAQRAVLLSLEQAFLLQKMNREDRGVATVAAAERQGAIFKIGKRGARTAADRDDLGSPANIGVTHPYRPAAM